MHRLETHVDPDSPAYRAYREHNLALAAELRETLHKARHERPQRALDRLAEQHKLPVRERLDLLLDRGSPFLELMCWPPTATTTARRRRRCWSRGSASSAAAR